MIWAIIKNSASDIWDEMLYLIIFNIIWFISLFLFIWPLVTFGLFFTAYDVSEAKGIGLSTFWKHARRMWRQAYLWGGINLAVFLVAWLNLYFYAHLQAQWAGLAQMFILALMLFWFILQLIALAFYPRLEQPHLKLALRNAGLTMGRYPLAVLTLVGVVALVLAIASRFPAIFLIAFSVITVTANRLVAAVAAKEKREEEQQEAGNVRRGM